MRTKEIGRYRKTGVGFGRDRGEILEIRFECPCGKGCIIEEHDEIPGFKNKDVFIRCPDCTKKHTLDISNGVSNWQLIEKEAK